MSYILEALKKAERERNLGQVPKLESVYATPTPEKRRWWPWLLVLALVANVAVLTIILVGIPEIGDARKAAPIASSAQTTDAEDLPDAKSQDGEPPLAAAPEDAEPSLETQETRLSFASEPDLGPQILPAPASVFLDDYAAGTGSPPPLRMLPAEFRRTLPPINIDVHVYSEDPEKRFVLVNSRPYREGDQLVEGPLLEMITTDGAVMLYQGQRFIVSVHR